MDTTATLPELPDSFFDDATSVVPNTTVLGDLHQQQRGPNTHSASKAMLWYDAIIDDMLAHPGTTQKDIALRLGKSPVTICYVVNSDMFRARYAARRNQFNADLDARLIGKLGQVAEKALDYTILALEKKQEATPLALLNEIQDKALSRLGYGPKPGQTAVAVTINNEQKVAVPSTVSASALAEARATLRTIEHSRAESSLAPPPAARVMVEDGSGGSSGAL